MSRVTATVDRAALIDLGREPDFNLGAARVHPSALEVTVGDQRIRLQRRVMQVLVALARAEGEILMRDDLVSSCWGGLAIGDDAIQRCVARLRRLSEEEAPGAFIIETLPRVGYRLRRGEGVMTEAAPRRRFTLTWIAIIGAVSAAVLVTGAWVALGSPGWRSEANGVALLPFETPPGDTQAREFAAGLTDDVASTLTKSDLGADSRGATGAIPKITRDAGTSSPEAAITLSGQVRRVGGALAVTVTVDDAHQRKLLWSADFTGDPAQGLEDEVTARVAGVLHCALSKDEAGGVDLDPENTHLVLLACDQIDTYGETAKLRLLFGELLARQPNVGNTWARFALVTALQSQELTGSQALAAAAQARRAANRALQLSPKAALAYVALETLTPQSDLIQRENLLMKGLSLSPDNAVLNFHESQVLSEVGRIRDEVTYMRRAVELDPFNPRFSGELGAMLARFGGVVEARVMLGRAADIWPHNTFILVERLATEARYGDPNVALRLLSDLKSRPDSFDDVELRDWQDFAVARQSGSPVKIAQYEAKVMATLAARRLGVAQAIVRLTSLNDPDATFLVASKATPDDQINTEPFFRLPATAVRADKRFLPLMARTGVLAYWRKTGRWADYCEAADRPYDCRAASAKLGL